jgi:GTP-binding protein
MVTSKASVVAIVGRANVGKSSLFNTVLGRRENIVAIEAGTTRDAITARASYSDKDFWLVDTAGMKPAEDDFELSIQDQITEATAAADIIVVVVAADVPPQAEDRDVAKKALRSRKPVILAVNKSDKPAVDLDEWQKLGIKQIIATSATQRQGIDKLLQTISADIPQAKIPVDDKRISLAILGRPNVGKSSLFNTLAAKQQALVSPQAGTTRDVNKLTVRYHEREIEIADTAGIRRSGKIERGVEHFSVLRAISAIEQSDICLMVMDVNELNVALDQKIAGMIKDAGKGLILVVSKWDTLEDGQDRERIAGSIANHFDFVPWAPLVFTSSVSGQNVTKIFDIILTIMKERQRKIKTTEINRWLGAVVNQHPPAGLHGSNPKLKYMVQETDQDWPNFKLFGSKVKDLHWSYRRYLERKLREEFGFEGTPIKIWYLDQAKLAKAKAKG